MEKDHEGGHGMSLYHFLQLHVNRQ
jgi:hypothetical protein